MNNEKELARLNEWSIRIAFNETQVSDKRRVQLKILQLISYWGHQ